MCFPLDPRNSRLPQEAFAIGDILKELPCQHRFHQGERDVLAKLCQRYLNLEKNIGFVSHVAGSSISI